MSLFEVAPVRIAGPPIWTSRTAPVAPVVEFRVFGTPRPQGSKKAFIANGHAVMKDAGGNEHASWRNAVAQAAHDNIPPSGRLDGPLSITLTFRFKMPSSRSKAVRTAGLARKTTAPDIDKLQRTVFDALMAGGLIRDDATICDVGVAKYETTDWTGVTVQILKVTG